MTAPSTFPFTSSAADPNTFSLTSAMPVPSTFPLTSRYASTPTANFQAPDGKVIVYLQRRFVPPPEDFQLLQIHVVTASERLDNITFQYLGDAEQFWRICDANGAM